MLNAPLCKTMGVTPLAAVRPVHVTRPAGLVSGLTPLCPQRRASVSTKPAVVCEASALPGVVAPDTLSPAATYQAIVDMGAKKASLSAVETFVRAVVSGIFIAFGGLLALSVGANCPALMSSNPGLQKILLGFIGLPLGLLLTLMTGMELFTGNTASMTAAVIENKADTGALAKNWVCSYAGNLAGTLFFVWAAGVGGVVFSNPAVAVASAKTSLTFVQAFTRGIFANWLVCLAIWMATASSTLPGKIMGILMPISSFVAMGFEHSVANMFLIPYGFGFMSAGLTFSSFMDFCTSNLIPVTLGNIVGGAFCLAVLSSYFYGSLGGKQ